jgi:hypothetical protein
MVGKQAFDNTSNVSNVVSIKIALECIFGQKLIVKGNFPLLPALQLKSRVGTTFPAKNLLFRLLASEDHV